MQAKIQIEKVEPTAYKAMLGLESYIQHSGLEKKLIELIKIRASQINGCAFCIDLHAHLARENGETEQRLYALSAWRETPFFTHRERAALAFTEAITLSSHPCEQLEREVNHHFSQNEIVQILMAIVTINGWNRLAIATGMVPGTARMNEVSQES